MTRRLNDISIVPQASTLVLARGREVEVEIRKLVRTVLRGRRDSRNVSFNF